jgi:DNA transformation protein
MTVSAEYTEYILEKLEPLGTIVKSRFFGGVALSFQSIQFAMIMGSTLYFVVNEKSRDKYKAKGMEPFSYATKKGTVLVHRYWSVPEEALEEPDELKRWAHEAIDAAMRLKK